MLRRFEIYSLDPNAPKDLLAKMDKSMRHAQSFIPEVLHSAVGYNKSEVGLDLVWEHGYASSEAYQRYMIHPFHANVYDRYLLNDSPERLVTNNEYDVGLLGYSCETPVYFLPNGAGRRLVFVRLKKGAEERFKAIVESAKAKNPKMIQSVLAENTFGTRWLDGVTQMLPDTTYSHIWEQGYRTLADAESSGNGWQAEAEGLYERCIELWYEVEGGHGYENDAPR
jgi:hypothetical protein